MKELTTEATIDNIGVVTDFVNEQLQALACPMKVQLQIDMAIDELFSNIARYAYHPEIGSATVRVDVTEHPMAVRITFIDQGIPYDPLSAANPDTTLSAEERNPGGLGIYLVRQTMDDVSYEYRGGQNILTIQKQL